MREYILTFASDDIGMKEIFDALHDAGMRNFKVKEVLVPTFENWKKDVDGACAENAQAQTCGNCKYDCDGCCRFEYIRHDSDYTCEKFEPTVSKNATVQKQIELVEE